MKYEIDHIFILVSKDAPEAQLLINFGFTEGPSRIHQGQGTANRCFFFNNVMLELIWVYDEQDAQNKVTAPTTLWPRWNNRNSTASTFGLCIRGLDGAKDKNQLPPFESWKYQPDLFPPGMFVNIDNSVTILELPFIFHAPTGVRQDSYIDSKIRDHRIGFKELTAISLNKPTCVYSDAFSALLNQGIFELNSNLENITVNKIELQFDNAKQGYQKDFSPELPLIIRW